MVSNFRRHLSKRFAEQHSYNPTKDTGASVPVSGGPSGPAAGTASTTPVENPPGTRYFDDQGRLSVALVKIPQNALR